MCTGWYIRDLNYKQMKKYYSALFLLVALAGCIKDPQTAAQIDCEAKNYGRFQLTNVSLYQYDVFINGKQLLRTQGKTAYKDVQVTPGFVDIEFRQVNGYLLYPTVNKTSILVGKCQDYTFIFPE
ncbi:hypothetical protein F5984_18780 [Rudanella paleaurantiibacter]|uniref:Uncharacterized protein n=1 Tax=Rudanella paleaurantiibacter TaxID=2614655 RepID=A0A7J5TVU7_9BACT|nr:hypothetical protein [Rudanella paleaurantiibacter]KAB7728417.1 hypothetical protein F5984_18780 [Rudanella paleaurantiibacter]